MFASNYCQNWGAQSKYGQLMSEGGVTAGIPQSQMNTARKDLIARCGAGVFGGPQNAGGPNGDFSHRFSLSGEE